MFEKVAEMLSRYFKVDAKTITPDTDIKKDLKADSVAVMEMLFELEDEMDITIPDDKVESFARVGTLVDYLESVKKA